jgi:ribosomal protein S12 methylthiotransferase
VTALVDELVTQRAEDRIGSRVDVLIETADDDEPVVGRAAHQGPDVDGTTALADPGANLVVGRIVAARVSATDGVDLIAEPLVDGGQRSSVSTANGAERRRR